MYWPTCAGNTLANVRNSRLGAAVGFAIAYSRKFFRPAHQRGDPHALRPRASGPVLVQSAGRRTRRSIDESTHSRRFTPIRIWEVPLRGAPTEPPPRFDPPPGGPPRTTQSLPQLPHAGFAIGSGFDSVHLFCVGQHARLVPTVLYRLFYPFFRWGWLGKAKNPALVGHSRKHLGSRGRGKYLWLFVPP